MWIIKRIQKYLNEGYEVILRKDSDGAHQVSYSRVTRIEGTHLRRTMFEALSIVETYNYQVGKYTTQWIEDNDRVSFFWKGKALDWHKVVQYESPYHVIDEEEDDFQDDVDDEEECNGDYDFDEELDDGNHLVNTPCCSSPRHWRLKRVVL